MAEHWYSEVPIPVQTGVLPSQQSDPYQNFCIPQPGPSKPRRCAGVSTYQFGSEVLGGRGGPGKQQVALSGAMHPTFVGLY